MTREDIKMFVRFKSMVLGLVLLTISVFGFSKEVIIGGSISGPQTLDPAQAWEEISVSLISNLFETLVKLNPETSEIEPGLALTWKTRNQGKTWIFNLKKGVRFHDGSIFDSESVVFSFKRQMDKTFKYRFCDTPLFDGIFKNLLSVSAMDSHTVAFDLKDPFYPFLASLTSSCAAIVSPAAVKKYGKKFYENPVGTGPFRLKIWEKGKRIILMANPDYWGGRPKFDEYINIENNYESMHKLFRDKKYDFINSVSISRTAGLKNMSWVTLKLFPNFSITFIAFNFKNKYLQKENIRKVIRYSWDDRILKYVFQDFVLSLRSVLPSGIPGYREILNSKEFSIEKASRLIKREISGEKIILNFLMPKESSLDRLMISKFLKNLKRVGIEVQLESLSQNEYDRRIRNGDFDLTFSGWISDYPDPYSILSALFDGQLQKNGFANISSYQDDGLRLKIQQTVIESDTHRRREIFEEIIKRIDEKVLCIPIYQAAAVMVFNNQKINRMVVTPVGNLSLFDIELK